MPIAARIEADVVVVGGGGAGLAAAIEAASCGAGVILIEKNPALGGTTAWSVGSVSASCTPDQRRVGVVDTPQAHAEDMTKFTAWREDRDNPALRALLTEKSAETIAWLRQLGVEFIGPFEEPPHRVPRMHAALPDGKAYIHHMRKYAGRLGVRIMLNTRAKRIVIDCDRTTGVEAEIAGSVSPDVIAARRGLILAGGDYSNSADMKRRWANAELAAVPGINPTATGDCQRMIEEIGGEIINADLIAGPRLRFPPPPGRRFFQKLPPYPVFARVTRWALRRLPAAIIRPFVLAFVTTALGPEPSLFKSGALLVNLRGERCPVGDGVPAQVVASQPEQMGYLIFDDVIARKYSAWPHFVSTAPGVAYAYVDDYRRTRPDLYRRANTQGALAAQLDIDPSRLTHALDEHDADARRSGVPPLAAPFHALGPIKAVVTMTDGGARVSADMQVLTKQGLPIAGLYAAGSTGQGGLLLEGHGHHLAWAFTSGRIAGRNAARAV